MLGLSAAMVFVCRAMPSPALANRNDPTVRGPQPRAKPHHILVTKDHELTQLIPELMQLTALDLSLLG